MHRLRIHKLSNDLHEAREFLRINRLSQIPVDKGISFDCQFSQSVGF